MSKPAEKARLEDVIPPPSGGFSEPLDWPEDEQARLQTASRVVFERKREYDGYKLLRRVTVGTDFFPWFVVSREPLPVFWYFDDRHDAPIGPVREFCGALLGTSDRRIAGLWQPGIDGRPESTLIIDDEEISLDDERVRHCGFTPSNPPQPYYVTDHRIVVGTETLVRHAEWILDELAISGEAETVAYVTREDTDPRSRDTVRMSPGNLQSAPKTMVKVQNLMLNPDGSQAAYTLVHFKGKKYRERRVGEQVVTLDASGTKEGPMFDFVRDTTYLADGTLLYSGCRRDCAIVADQEVVSEWYDNIHGPYLSRDETDAFFDVRTGRQWRIWRRGQVTRDDRHFSDFAWAPDGGFVSARIHDDGQYLEVFGERFGPREQFSGLQFSPDGGHLAGVVKLGNARWRLWVDGRLVGPTCEDITLPLKWSADSQHLVFECIRDGRVSVVLDGLLHDDSFPPRQYVGAFFVEEGSTIQFVAYDVDRVTGYEVSVEAAD